MQKTSTILHHYLSLTALAWCTYSTPSDVQCGMASVTSTSDVVGHVFWLMKRLFPTILKQNRFRLGIDVIDYLVYMFARFFLLCYITYVYYTREFNGYSELPTTDARIWIFLFSLFNIQNAYWAYLRTKRILSIFKTGQLQRTSSEASLDSALNSPNSPSNSYKRD